MKKTFLLLAGTIAMLAVGPLANASIVVTTTSSDTTSPPTISNTDLGQNAVVTLTAGGLSNGANLAALNDGIVGNLTGTDGTNTALNDEDSVTYTFDTTVNTLGYDITEIFTVAGWATGSGGRSNQGYEIELTYVDGTTATLVPGAHHAPNSPASFFTTVQLTDTSGGTLTDGAGITATGVEAITFDITENANAGGIVIFREFDVFGTATVSSIPEPSSAALLGLTGLGLMLVRRKR